MQNTSIHEAKRKIHTTRDLEPTYEKELKRLTSTRNFHNELKNLLKTTFNYEPIDLEHSPPLSLTLLYCWAKAMNNRTTIRRR